MSVTKLACAECGAEISQAATGRPRHTCSDACRSKAYRRRHRRPAEGGNGFDLVAEPRLTTETRELLRLAINRRTRERLRVVRGEDLAADRALFADEVEP